MKEASYISLIATTSTQVTTQQPSNAPMQSTWLADQIPLISAFSVGARVAALITNFSQSRIHAKNRESAEKLAKENRELTKELDNTKRKHDIELQEIQAKNSLKQALELGKVKSTHEKEIEEIRGKNAKKMKLLEIKLNQEQEVKRKNQENLTRIIKFWNKKINAGDISYKDILLSSDYLELLEPDLSPTTRGRLRNKAEEVARKVEELNKDIYEKTHTNRDELDENGPTGMKLTHYDEYLEILEEYIGFEDRDEEGIAKLTKEFEERFAIRIKSLEKEVEALELESKKYFTNQLREEIKKIIKRWDLVLPVEIGE
ncbi:hypothetical protein IQ265_06565 [Nodosilinea sp. LEGE 06152]|nr:hypothetical protein [Nodosilinea sp. LEGE 06152]